MADYFLTRRAVLDLQEIHAHSQEQWGESVADKYIADNYQVFKQIAKKPELGKRRQCRSHPFYMVPAQKHFVVYEPFVKGIIIVTLLHQVRDIETIMKQIEPSLMNEIT